jgi:hypothetical protein
MDLFNILERTAMTVEAINEHANAVMEFEPLFDIQANSSEHEVPVISDECGSIVEFRVAFFFVPRDGERCDTL